MYLFMCVNVYNVCIRLNMYLCIYLHVCMHAIMYLCVYVCMCVCMYALMCVCCLCNKHVYRPMHVCMYKRTDVRHISRVLAMLHIIIEHYN